MEYPKRQPVRPTQCEYCNGPHQLERCSNIESLPHTDKLNFLRNQGLCFRCLSHGHISSGCSQTASCRLCNRAHQTILHIQRGDQISRREAATGTPQVSSMSTCNGECETTMAVIPVKVKTRDGTTVETYAFMDPGSSISFCSTSLAEKLGCSGKPATVTIDTMGSPHTMDTRIIQGIQVCDLHLNNEVQMPPVYTKDRIPVSQNLYGDIAKFGRKKFRRRSFEFARNVPYTSSWRPVDIK